VEVINPGVGGGRYCPTAGSQVSSTPLASTNSSSLLLDQ
jgi:hypothetical protein